MNKHEQGTSSYARQKIHQDSLNPCDPATEANDRSLDQRTNKKDRH
jgi:hypothetical protein